MSDQTLHLTWYGRCCFLAKYQNFSVLFDPYDSYAYVDVGVIPSDVCLISSVWHDHGHIGASPQSHIYAYEGRYTHGPAQITAIKALENRGSSTLIFNVQMGPWSLTNLADFGVMQRTAFDAQVSKADLETLRSTTILFMRPSIVGEQVEEVNVHNEIGLEYCRPAIVFPEHYHPTSFAEKVPEPERSKLLKQQIVVQGMKKNLALPWQLIDGYEITVQPEKLTEETEFWEFSHVHPQVSYRP